MLQGTETESTAIDTLQIVWYYVCMFTISFETFVFPLAAIANARCALIQMNS